MSQGYLLRGRAFQQASKRVQSLQLASGMRASQVEASGGEKGMFRELFKAGYFTEAFMVGKDPSGGVYIQRNDDEEDEKPSSRRVHETFNRNDGTYN